MQRILTSLFILFLLTSCGNSNSNEQLSATISPPDEVKVSTTPSSSPSQTLTLTPTNTFTPQPSATPSLTSTSTPTPLPWGTIAISTENATEVVQLAAWGRGSVYRYERTEAGQLLVLSSLGIYLYQADNFELLADFPGGVRFLISDDQQLAAILFGDGLVSIVDVVKGEKKFDLKYAPKVPANFCKGCDEKIISQYQRYFFQSDPLDFSKDHSKLAVASIDGSILVWNMEDGKQIARLYHDSGGMDQGILFTSDGQHLLTIGRQPAAYVRYSSMSYWSIEEEKMLWYQKVSGRLDARLSSPDGNLVGVLIRPAGLNEDVVRLYQRKDGKFVGQINGQIHENPYSPDSKFFITYHSNSVLVWKIQPEFVLVRTIYPSVEVTFAEISDDGLNLVINGGELSYLLSDFQKITTGKAKIPEPEPIYEISSEQFAELGHLQNLTGMMLTEDQKLFVWGGFQNVWRWSPLEDVLDWLHFETEPMSQPVLSEDGGKVAACSKENLSVAVWENSTIANLERCLQNGILTFSPEGTALAYGFNTQLLTINPLDGKTIQGFYGSGYPITWLEYAQEGRYLASGGKICTMTCQGDLRLWDIVNAKGVSLEADGSVWPVTDVVFSSDSQLMIAAKRFIWIWDTNTGKLMGRFSNTGIKLALSPDDQLLAVADQDGMIHLLNMSDREEIVAWQTNQSSIISLDFRADGASLLSLAEDGSLKLWGIR